MFSICDIEFLIHVITWAEVTKFKDEVTLCTFRVHYIICICGACVSAGVPLQNLSPNIRKKPYLTRAFDAEVPLLSEFESRVKISQVSYQAKRIMRILAMRRGAPKTRVKRDIFAILLKTFCFS